jgi:hypothetical protein
VSALACSPLSAASVDFATRLAVGVTFWVSSCDGVEFVIGNSLLVLVDGSKLNNAVSIIIVYSDKYFFLSKTANSKTTQVESFSLYAIFCHVEGMERSGFSDKVAANSVTFFIFAFLLETISFVAQGLFL